MKNLSIAATLAMIAATTLSARAETVAYSANPIKVLAYSVSPERAFAIAQWEGYSEDLVPGNVRISFANTGARSIRNVEFVLRSKKDREIIVDDGNFSQNATIVHDFALNSDLGESADLEVEQVTFADGAVWNRT